MPYNWTMVERHNEISGGRFDGPVVQAGSIDRLTLHFHGGPVEPDRPLTSWRDRPPLSPALRDLLEAQQRATEALPYKLLGVRQPELTQVYVQQTIRPQLAERPPEPGRKPEPERKQAPESAERVLSITEALDRGGHLVLTGEPGSGKSTVGYLYVQQLSAYWLGDGEGQPPLSEPLLPLRVPARALAANRAWAELLAAGTEEALGRLLSERPRPEVFARRALGARWLVFVDGLDEIIEPETRAQVIDAIAYQVRRGADHRLVVTTRPLPGRELAPFERAGLDTYHLQPFGPGELAEFAGAWFRAQNPVTAAGRAAEFVRQVGDGRLRELVRNPLLATIAAIAHTLEPQRPLPNSRVDLYDRFMAYLLDETPSRRDTVAELRRSLRDQPERLAFAEWLRKHRTEIVEQLAAHRLESESPLFEAACEWVAGQGPELPEGWREDLRALLASTGVFEQTDDVLDFRHYSFAEFLAARRRAREISADFPGLDEWIERGMGLATQAFALFTFVLWGRAGNELGRVFEVLLAGAKDEVLFAGRLLAEGIEIGDRLAAAVVDRILDALLANGARRHPWSDVEEIGQVLVSFVPETLGAPAIARLRELRDAPELSEATRLECAAVLGRVADTAEAARWLESFAERASLPALHRCVLVLKELVPDGATIGERLLVRLVAGAAADFARQLALLYLLDELGRGEAAAPLLREVVVRLRADPAVTDGAGFPLGSRLVDVWEDGTASWGNLADLAVRLHCAEEGLWAAEKVFARESSSADELNDAVLAVLAAKGGDGVPEILAATETRPVEHVLGVAVTLQEESHPRAAAALARNVLERPNAGPYEFVRAARVLATCGESGELLRLVENKPGLGIEYKLRLLALGSDLGDQGALREEALSSLDHPGLDKWDLANVVQALLEDGDAATAERVVRAAGARGPEYWARLAGVLCAQGHGEAADELAGKLLAAQAQTDLLVEVALAAAEHRPALAAKLLDAAYPRLLDCDGYQRHQLVRALTKIGRREQAVAAARLATLATDEIWVSYCVENWIDAGGAEAGREIVAVLVSVDTPADKRMEAADKLAELGLLEPAARLWLDVVRHHGRALDQAVLAARCLVESGHRDEVAALLGERGDPVLRACVDGPLLDS